ncbi:MAG: bifunctional nuclease family protein [Bacteroidetes bacterium]|jgi:bifunctional DNase/RNase|nr:bifunctional nuclease family protein [Bacteroidota bacterium]
MGTGSKIVKLFIVAMAPSQQKPESFVLVLEEEKRKKRLPLLIGKSEAFAIGIALEDLKIKRPMTHDLLLSSILALNGHPKHILITNKVDGIFHSDIVIELKDDQTKFIDCRTSDAIAFAIRAKIPIYINSELLHAEHSEEKIFLEGNRRSSFAAYTLDELEVLLDKVLQKEDYQSAARIKETIEKKRKTL